MADEEGELGPIGGLVLSFVVVAAGWFMTGATNYVLAIGPFSTGIGMPIVGWGFVIFGALGLLGSGIEFREEYLGGGEAAGGGQNWPERQVKRPESEQSRQQATDTQDPPRQANAQREQSQQQASTQRPSPQSPDRETQQEQTGQRQEQPEPQSERRQPRNQQQTGLQCPNCQQHVAAGKAYCSQCGTRVR